MACLNVKLTRIELSNPRERLKTATRGHKLLKDKRDELMRRSVGLTRENNELREEVEAALVGHVQGLVMTKSPEDTLMVEEMFSVPTKEVWLFIEIGNVMSIIIPKMHSHIESPYDDNNGDVVYSYLASDSGMDDTLAAIEGLTEKLLHLAEIEKSHRLVADETEKTRRRANSLEYSTIPRLEETIHYIELKLEETEHTDLARIVKVKQNKKYLLDTLLSN